VFVCINARVRNGVYICACMSMHVRVRQYVRVGFDFTFLLNYIPAVLHSCSITFLLFYAPAVLCSCCIVLVFRAMDKEAVAQ